ncbi:MAG: nucleotide exchange factor GrpE [Mariprofundales bacterium]
MTKKQQPEDADAEISAQAQPEPETEPTPLAPEAQEKIDEINDKLLRAHAEMDNLRKRSAREIADARKFAVERFATSLLDVVDNLERALDVEQGQEQALRDGIQLTLDSWHTLMERFEMERFDAVGEHFDAHRHEALSQVPSDEPKDIIIAQHVAGYTLHGRLIRPAKVLVSAGSG